MAEFNACSKLINNEILKEAKDKYNDLLSKHIDPFSVMLNMQHSLQLKLHEKNPKCQDIDNLKTLGQKFEYLREQKQAFDDEYREVIDALAGMSLPEKERSALWKRWKAKHDELQNKTFDDLSEEEMIELKFELCDAFHFFMNMFFPINMSAEEMFIYYYIKNLENFNRCKRGY